jgi:hypothetical protein
MALSSECRKGALGACLSSECRKGVLGACLSSECRKGAPGACLSSECRKGVREAFLSSECRKGFLGACFKLSYLNQILIANSFGLKSASDCTSDIRMTLQMSSQYIKYQDSNSSAMTVYQKS